MQHDSRKSAVCGEDIASVSENGVGTARTAAVGKQLFQRFCTVDVYKCGAGTADSKCCVIPKRLCIQNTAAASLAERSEFM